MHCRLTKQNGLTATWPHLTTLRCYSAEVEEGGTTSLVCLPLPCPSFLPSSLTALPLGISLFYGETCLLPRRLKHLQLTIASDPDNEQPEMGIQSLKQDPLIPSELEHLSLKNADHSTIFQYLPRSLTELHVQFTPGDWYEDPETFSFQHLPSDRLDSFPIRISSKA